MIARTISGNVIESPHSDGKLDVPIDFEWFETDKRRMAKVAEDGTEFGIMVGRTIKDGDVLSETEDKRYYARIRTAQLIEIPVNSMREMGRLCFELGNRHLSLKIKDDCVLVPYDHPTMEYTRKIGYKPRKIEGEFQGFLIVKAHAGTGTMLPGSNKTTGDLSDETNDSEDRQSGIHAHEVPEASTDEPADYNTISDKGPIGEYERNGVLHRPDGSHSHDGGRTWHTH